MVLLLLPIFLEFASRTIHAWNAPLLPYFFDAGPPLIPPGIHIKASFARKPANEYATDLWSARIDAPSLAHTRMRSGVFVLGDSQVLGYMLDFRQTFASLLANRMAGGPANARILAAPAVHPGHFEAMLKEYAPRGLEPQKLIIAGFNLGNDLDEMYSELFRWRKERSSIFSRWLLLHSFVFMDFRLLQNHWLQPGNEPVGVNPILYMLSPDERIILTREAVRKIDGALADPRLSAERKVVVITPSDYQVDPAQFEKYRKYYREESDFERWDQQMPAFASMMSALEGYAASQLTSRGYTVVRFSRFTAGHASAELFDDSSHHLTAYGHRLLADEIAHALESGR